MLRLSELTEEYLGSLKYVDEIPREFSVRLKTSDILAIVGPRRVGKTFVMLKACRELLNASEQALYVPLDEPSLRNIGFRKLAELIRMEYPEGNVHLFLDEVQEWRDWDYGLRWLHDVKDFRLYVSGSSSALLASEIPSRLRGRYVSRVLYPLSFREVVKFRVRTFRERGKVLALLEDYLKWGGFPEVWVSKSREKLVSLLETIFYRDIIERFRIRDIDVFKEVFYFVLSNYSNPFTYRGLRRLLKGLGVEVDVKTVISYLNCMKQALLIMTCELLTPSSRKRTVNPRKAYLIDHALANLFPRTLDKGRVIENVVFVELKRRLGALSEVHYYRTRKGEEVDFVVTEAGRPKEVIEAAFTHDAEHLRKVSEAAGELGLKEATLVTWDEEHQERINGITVKVKPLWKWLLHRE